MVIRTKSVILAIAILVTSSGSVLRLRAQVLPQPRLLQKEAIAGIIQNTSEAIGMDCHGSACAVITATTTELASHEVASTTEVTSVALSPNMEIKQADHHQYRATLSLKPNRYADAAGTWQPIAPRFTQTEAGGGSSPSVLGSAQEYYGSGSLVQVRLPVAHAVGAHSVKGVAYSSEEITTELASTTQQSRSLRVGTIPVTVSGEMQWTPTRMVMDGATVFRVGADRESSSVSELNGNIVTYPNVYGGFTERMSLLAEGMKDDIIIPSAASLFAELTPQLWWLSHGPSGIGDLGFETVVTLSTGLAFYIDGVRQTVDFTTTGALEVRDEQGKPLFLLPPVSANDAGAISDTVRGTYIGHYASDGFYLTAAIPFSWLSAPERMYPVTIDPTVYIWPSTADTLLWGTNPLTNWGTLTYVMVGDVYRTLLRWDIIPLPSFAMVDSAQANMYMTSVSGYPLDAVYAFSISSPWNEYA